MEAAAVLPVLGLFLAGTLGLGALLVARELLLLDAYFLARAHLYGNASGQCRESPLWPPLHGLAFDFDCNGRGRVRGRLEWHDEVLAEVAVDLERGVLKREITQP